jgi:parvulin-like peptidyl-prolyl isomerase
MFNAVVKERIDQHKAMDAKVDEATIKKTVADELVAEALLVKTATAKNYTVTDEEVTKAIEQARGKKSEKEFKEEIQKSGMSYDVFFKRVKNQMIISKMMVDLVKDDSVPDADMKEFYSKNRDLLFSPEKVNVRILQFKTEAEAKEVSEKLKKGEDFDTLADGFAKSGKASATNYGWLEPSFLSKDLAAAMKTAPLNTAQGPFKGKDGTFYFFKAKERTKQALSFNDAKEQIKGMILSKKRQEIAAHLVENSKKTAKIQMNV